jgi:hypothetical protein
MHAQSLAFDNVSAREIIDAAAAAGLSVADYLERTWGASGNRHEVARELVDRIGPESPVNRVCEIGSGAGLLTEGIIQHFQPPVYESYEPDPGWSEWLARHFSVTSHPSDGRSLQQTPDACADLVAAHGVFVYLPFLLTYGYLEEAARVTSLGGYVAFDILSEYCLDDSAVRKWLASGEFHPSVFPRDYAIRLLARRGCIFQSSFFDRRCGAARSEFLVFRKDARV